MRIHAAFKYPPLAGPWLLNAAFRKNGVPGPAACGALAAKRRCVFWKVPLDASLSHLQNL
jgi:hypothetical protein